MKRIAVFGRHSSVYRRFPLLLVTCLSIFGSSRISMGQISYNLTPINFPGSSFSQAWDINNTGEIVGAYSMGGRHFGFLLSGGTYTTIDPPGASYSEAQGINDAGQIVGWYNDGGDVRHYFIYSSGNYTSYDSPSPFSTAKFLDINNLSQIVGTHGNGSNLNGFLFSGGNFSSVDYPGATETVPTKINDLGQITGHYSSYSGNNGFLLSGVTFTLIAFPGATSTAADGINNSGQIVGAYVLSGTFHGYLFTGGMFTTIDFPGSLGLTEILGINDSSIIVGEYADGTGTHGFLGTPVVTYNICPLYDQTKAVKSGATIPIKLQLCDGNGVNLSASGVVVTATAVTRVSDNVSGLLEDAGNANPDNNFRYDSALGGSAGYVFNFSTRSLAFGTYRLTFVAGFDPTIHGVEFQVK